MVKPELQEDLYGGGKTKTKMSKEELIEEILDIINSENSGLSHQQRLNEIENLLNQNKDE